MQTGKSSPNSQCNQAGLSWLRVLATVAIVLVLLGVTSIFFRTTGGRPGNVDLTRARLQMIRLNLEDYAAEHGGIYPVGEDDSSAVLYRVLSGDESGQGKPPTAPVYWKELNSSTPSLVGTLNGQKVILDGFGNAFRYRSALDKNGQPVQGVKDGEDFALWSVGPDGKTSEPDNFESEATQDDIWE